MKKSVTVVASAALLVVALAGCSAGSLPGTAAGSGTASTGSTQAGGSSSGSGNGGPTMGYSATDLVTILKKTEAARGLTGTIKTDADLKSDSAGLKGYSLTQSFTAQGGKFEPAACGTLLDSLIADSENVLEANDWTGASLSADSDIISLASTGSQSKTAAVIAQTRDTMSKLTSQCSTMSISLGTTSIAFTIAPASASSNASQTYGYEEDITVSGQAAIKTLTIEAVYGNLFIGDVAITNAKLPEMEANVNAVIAAAKG